MIKKSRAHGNTNNSQVLHGLEAVVDEAVDLDAQLVEISEKHQSGELLLKEDITRVDEITDELISLLSGGQQKAVALKACFKA